MENKTKIDCINYLLANEPMKSFQNHIYQRAISKTIADGKLSPSSPHYLPPDVLSIAKHHYQELLLSKHDFTGPSAQSIEYYIAGFPGLIRQREMTKAMTDFMVDFTTFCMYIAIWITHVFCPHLHITVQVDSRRKDYEGEVLKLFLSSMMLAYNNDDDSLTAIQPPQIRDLFGIRIIVEQTNDSGILLDVMKIFVKILSNTSSYERNAFYEWLKTSDKLYGGSPLPKEKLLPFQNYDFQLSHEKNYISHPKPNGYKTWQATYTLGPTSPSACGCMFEMQARTNEMHIKAEYGGNLTPDEIKKGLAHDEYKRKINQLKKVLFNLPKYSGGILYFDPRIGYDLDGVRTCKHIECRTSSVHLVSTV